MKLIQYTVFFIMGFFACLGWQYMTEPAVKESLTTQIQSLSDIQRQVGAKPDGIYGAETKKLWDRAICDQYAAECFEGWEK